MTIKKLKIVIECDIDGCEEIITIKRVGSGNRHWFSSRKHFCLEHFDENTDKVEWY